MEALRQQVRQIGESIILWARPEGWPEAPTKILYLVPTDPHADFMHSCKSSYTSYKDWPLASFDSALSIAVGYLLFVIFGSLIMKSLPTIKGLYPFKFIYNISQVMLCSYMCIEAGVRAYDAGYTLRPCNGFDHLQPPIAFILYVFYLSKILDFMDTIFIILEKRDKQLSFLHVYHHFSIFLFYWLNLNVGYDGDVYLTIVLNGLIHTVMYTYYFVSLHTKEIWWKSALTMCQMVQFVVMNSQAVYIIYIGCNAFPRRIVYTYGLYILSLLILFAQFFIASYMKPRRSSKKGAKSE